MKKSEVTTLAALQEKYCNSENSIYRDACDDLRALSRGELTIEEAIKLWRLFLQDRKDELLQKQQLNSPYVGELKQEVREISAVLKDLQQV